MPEKTNSRQHITKCVVCIIMWFGKTKGQFLHVDCQLENIPLYLLMCAYVLRPPQNIFCFCKEKTL